MKTNCKTMRSFSAALLLLSALQVTPAAAAVHPEAAASAALSRAELRDTMGGLESRIINVPIMGDAAVLRLPIGNKVNVEVTSQVFGVGDPVVTATGTHTTPVNLPVTFLASVPGTQPSAVGLTALYSVDVSPACTAGGIVLKIHASILNGAFTSETSRWVSCS